MTLDFKKLVLNAVKKQMSIQHFQSNVQVFKKEELPVSVQQKIQSAYGNDFLADANYTLWFSGNDLTKEIVEKTVFKVANAGLGNAANNMSESDLKMIDLGPGSADETPTATPDDVSSMTDAGADEANAKAVGDLMGGDEDADEMGDTEDADEMGDLDESVESPSAGEKFVFLKITMK